MNFFIKPIGNLLNTYLMRIVTVDKIQQCIKELNIEKSIEKSFFNVDRKHLTVAVAQVKIDAYSTIKDYIEAMNEHIKIAAEKKASLICFPEDNGLLLLGLIPFIKRFLENPLEHKERVYIKDTVFTSLKSLTPYLIDTFINVFGSFSREYGMYIMAGSLPVVEEDKLFNKNFMFGPNGKLLETQNKAHLLEREKSLGFFSGQNLTVLDTSIGKIGFPMCMDAAYYETFKILKKKGAEIVIVPTANIGQYDNYLALRGIWSRVQESFVYGLKSSLVGNIGSLVFTGKAGIFAPIGLTLDGSGVLEEAKTFDSKETIVATINLDALSDYKDDYFSDTNPELYIKYHKHLLEPCNNINS